MFKTTIIAATFAATAALTATAGAQTVPGSDFYQTRAEENARDSVAFAPRTTSVEAGSVYGYSQTVPGSSFGRDAAEEQARSNVRRGFEGRVAPSVNPGSDSLLPGSDYGQRVDEQQARRSVQ